MHDGERDLICSALRGAGFSFADPQGAYYFLAVASHLPGRSSKERAMWLREHTGVAKVPGEAFFSGSSAELLLRFCYAKVGEELDDACHRLTGLRVYSPARLFVKMSVLSCPE
jgi:aminotransferase